MNEYPPLWIVYGFMLVLPFVLMAFCCVKPRTKDDSARRKKTDEPTADDKPKDKKTRQTADVTSLSSPSRTITPDSPKETGESFPAKEGTTVESLHQRRPHTKATADSGGTDDRETVKTEASDVSKHTLVVSEGDLDSKEEQTSAVKDSIKEEDIGSMVVISHHVKKTSTPEEEDEILAPEEESGVETVGSAHVVKDNEEVSRVNGEGHSQVAGSETQSPTVQNGSGDNAISVAESKGKSSDEQDQQRHRQKDSIGEKSGSGKYQFPPVLEEFDLMECEADPSVLEQYFEDSRLRELWIALGEDDSLGLSIVGGKNSANGDLPIYVKKIATGGAAGKGDNLSEGDQLVAVNDKLFVDCTLEYAVKVLRNAQGDVRILYLSDY
jgi:hypothetical protein